MMGLSCPKLLLQYAVSKGRCYRYVYIDVFQKQNAVLSSAPAWGLQRGDGQKSHKVPLSALHSVSESTRTTISASLSMPRLVTTTQNRRLSPADGKENHHPDPRCPFLSWRGHVRTRWKPSQSPASDLLDLSAHPTLPDWKFLSVFTGNTIQWLRSFAEAKKLFSEKFSVQKLDTSEWKKIHISSSVL